MISYVADSRTGLFGDELAGRMIPNFFNIAVAGGQP